MSDCICHFAVKSIQRSAGRSVTASVAYRDGEKIKDERTGETFDYSKREGVEFVQNIIPSNVTRNYTTSELWNAAEQSETRVNSSVGREYIVALPVELTQEERQKAAVDFASYLVEQYGVAANVAVHLPGKNGDERNYHAHIMTSTRVLTPEGFGAKTRVLDDKATRAGEITRIREKWAELGNQYLERAGSERRMDPRSFTERGIDREPEIHLGPSASAIERRGEVSARGDYNRRVKQINALAAERDKVEREISEAKEAYVQEGRTEARAGYDAWKREREAAAERQREEQRQLRKQEEQREAERERATERDRDSGFSR